MHVYIYKYKNINFYLIELNILIILLSFICRILLTEFAEEIDTDFEILNITKCHALKKLQYVGNF